MYLLTGLTVSSSYVSAVLPATLVMGIGMGAVFASAMSLATLGVDSDDAGVASAMVNTMQQVGGSIGTALLNTIAATAAGQFIATHGARPATIAGAAVHSYTVAFWWSAAIFAAGAVLTAVLLRPGVPQIDADSEALVVL